MKTALAIAAIALVGLSACATPDYRAESANECQRTVRFRDADCVNTLNQNYRVGVVARRNAAVDRSLR